MKRTDIDARNTILEATRELIREHGDISKVTVRDICSRSGIGIGMVNYHFQTKENLIKQCVQKIVGSIIEGFDDLADSLDMPPYDKLCYLCKLNAKFLAEHPGISRVSILSDMESGSQNDNSTQTANAYLRLLRKLYKGRKTDEELRTSFNIIISTIQVAFLRSEVLKITGELDFNIESQRDKLVENIVEKVFMDLKDL